MPRTDGTPLRRSWAQRMLISANALALVAATATAGSLAYANRRVSDIVRVPISDDLAEETVEPGDPMNLLIVGIDNASGLDDDDPAKAFRDAPDVAGQHTDSMMIVRLDPRAGTAQLLSLPRDLWLPIADGDSSQRINTAYQTGGPSRLIRTIDEAFGIPIHHFVAMDFAGFGELVDIVGGVPITFPRPARDRDSGLDIPAAGCYTLGPRQALGFTRARYYDVQDADGDWHRDPRSDLSRMGRQQLFIELALGRAIAKGARNPNTLRRLIDLGSQSVIFDDSFDIGDLADIGIQYRSFRPDQLERYELPVVDDFQGGAQVLSLVEGAAEPILAVFRGVPPADMASVRPEDVTIQVLNGTGMQGQAGEASDALAALGFTTLGTTDADQPDLPTTVRYVPGGEAEAQLLARSVTGPVVYELADGLGGADAVLVTGSDWQGVAPTIRSLQEVPGPTAVGADPSGSTDSAGSTTPATDTSDPADSGTASTDAGATTGSGDPSDTSTTGSEPSTPTSSEPAADSDDPSDPGFYLARAPGPDEECPATE